MYTPIQAFKLFFARLFSVEGRSTRSEFWWVMLVVWPIQAFLQGLADTAALEYNDQSLFWLLFIALVLTGLLTLTLIVRRLHDRNMSGAWLLLYWVPLVGIILLIINILPSQHKTNKYGSDPSVNMRDHYDYYIKKQHLIYGAFNVNPSTSTAPAAASSAPLTQDLTQDASQQSQGSQGLASVAESLPEISTTGVYYEKR